MLYKNFKISNTCLPPLAIAATKRIGIVKTKWNMDIIEALFQDCINQLLLQGVQHKNIVVYEVPGSFELAYGVRQLMAAHACDVVICLGAIIQGATAHFDVLAHAITRGLFDMSSGMSTPLILGLLTCTHEQAIERVEQKVAVGWADSALMMTNLHPVEWCAGAIRSHDLGQQAHL